MVGITWSISSILIIAYLWTVVGVIATVLLENRNPIRTSAWVLLVGFIPFLGLIAYLIFGQEQRKLYRINKLYYRRLMRKPKQFSQEVQEGLDNYECQPWSKLITLAEENAHSSLLPLEASEIYTEGKAFYTALLQDIREAREHIHIQSYIFDNDSIFAQLRELLISKRHEGVDVRIIYDYLGSYSMPEAEWAKLKAEGILVYPFLPVYLPLLSSTVNYRNHRKVCVIDGHIGYIGGMNFADRYQYGNDLGIWRDTHFRLEGLAVEALQGGFLTDWYTVSRRVMPVERFVNPKPDLGKKPYALAQFVFGGPLEDYQAIEQLLTSLIYQAKSHILIQTPYFLPTEALQQALIASALSGVNIEIMIPDKADSRLTSLAMDSYLTPLMRAGVRVYRYQAGFIHSKLVLVDNEVSCIGSANIDFRSLEHNFELMGIVYDQTLTQRLSLIYAEDRSVSQAMDVDVWEQRPLKRRLAESTMRLFAPLL